MIGTVQEEDKTTMDYTANAQRPLDTIVTNPFISEQAAKQLKYIIMLLNG